MSKILLPFVIAVIHRDMAEKTPREVHPHEVPILHSVHGKEVSLANHEPLSEPRLVDPVEEYERLARLYGDDPKSGIPFVERIYGRISDFAKVLAEHAINEDELPHADGDDDVDNEGGHSAQSAPSIDDLRIELDAYTKVELQTMASDLRLEGLSQANKPQIIDAILAKHAETLAAQKPADQAT